VGWVLSSTNEFGHKSCKNFVKALLVPYIYSYELQYVNSFLNSGALHAINNAHRASCSNSTFGMLKNLHFISANGVGDWGKVYCMIFSSTFKHAFCDKGSLILLLF